MQRIATVVRIALVAEVLAFAVSTLPGVRSHPGFDTALDGWLQGAAYVTAALLCALRPIQVKAERTVWAWIALGLALRAIAFVLFLGFVRNLEPIPYPSISDGFWLAMYVAVLVALVTATRARFTGVATGVAVDGVLSGLAISALAVAALHGTLQDLTRPGTPAGALVTNVAYPAADLILLLVLLTVLVAFEWRPPAWIWALTAAIASFAVVDSVFVYQVTAGTYHPGSLIAALSLGATASIALVAWVRPSPAPPHRSDVLPGLVVPALATLACVGLLVYGSVERLPAAAVALAAAGLALTTVRAALTFRATQALQVEAERANAAKSEFLSRVSHELKTPLSSVLGFAQLIEADSRDERDSDSARRIVAAARHLLSLIEDLLDVARLERGEMRAFVERLSVEAVAREAIELAEPAAAARDLDLVSRLEHGEDHYAYGDFRRLRQVLLNLLSNAVKYNRDGGKIVVSIKEPAPGTVRVSVGDTGPGISEEQLGLLFRPFERLDAERTSKPGTCLGLAISKGLVEEMGGTLSVESEPGEGSTFCVDLRASPA